LTASRARAQGFPQGYGFAFSANHLIAPFQRGEGLHRLCRVLSRGNPESGPIGDRMASLTEPKLITGNASVSLAKQIARRMSLHRGSQVNLVDARIERFNDQEIFVEVFENVRGEDMYMIQSTSNPANDNLMELLIMTDALRRSSASRITAVIPYFGYARQDRRAKARTPISAKLVANLITEAGVDRVLTLDLHAAQIQGFFDIPVDNLYASPVFALDIEHHFKAQLHDVMVVSPDVGGVARARELAKRINAPLAIVDKRREKAGEIAEMTVIGNVTGKKCIIVDDICDTAGTLCKAAEVLMENGAIEVHAYIIHGVLSGPAVGRIEKSVMKSLVITDSIEPTAAVLACPNIRIVPMAPIFAQAILNIWGGMSVSSLFETETLVPIYDGMYLRD
jgi:ribose-phosphate pyrophosphokinase